MVPACRFQIAKQVEGVSCSTPCASRAVFHTDHLRVDRLKPWLTLGFNINQFSPLVLQSLDPGNNPNRHCQCINPEGL